MRTATERPTLADLDRLEVALSAEPPDPAALAAALQAVADGLRAHGRDLDRAGGLLADDQEAALRPTLAKRADELRDELDDLRGSAGRLQRRAEEAAADGPAARDWGGLRRRADELLESVRRLRHDEAEVVLDGANTDLGGGD